MGLIVYFVSSTACVKLFYAVGFFRNATENHNVSCSQRFRGKRKAMTQSILGVGRIFATNF